MTSREQQSPNMAPLPIHPEPARAYPDRWAHLRAELELLDSLLAELVSRLRQTRPVADSPSAAVGWGHGVFVGEDEIDAFLGSVVQRPSPEAQRAQIHACIEASQESRIDLPLVRLARTFGLTGWEQEVILLCLAPEIDHHYERIYAYLQDDANRRRPSLALAVDLVGDDIEVRARARASLSESAALIRSGLISLVDDGQGPVSHRLTHLLKIDERVAAYLLGDPSALQRDWIRMVHPEAVHGGGIAEQLIAVASTTLGVEAGHKLIVALHGDRSEALAVAGTVCSGLDLPMIVVDAPLLVASAAPFDAAIREAARESLLIPAALLVQGADRLAEQAAEQELRLHQLRAALDDFAWLAFITAAYPLTAGSAQAHPWLTLEVPSPSISLRAARWQSALSRAGMEVDDDEVDSLAGRFQPAASDLSGIVANAIMRARVRGPEQRLTLRDIEAACRDSAGAALAGLARRVTPRRRWPDLVLPEGQTRQLHEISEAISSRRRVMADWGFAARLSRGRGLSALYSGSPGTGKTLAAEIIAAELGLDLFEVDLANVVSKYIGETEKNLSKIFDAAESTSALLFFDEADALFGKRSDVKDAHDRYANIELSYLLQRIESYEGLVILATNLRRNVDEAFLRRLTYVVEFPFPDAAERHRIWTVCAAPEMPIAEGIDWEFLAGRFNLAGGNIKGAMMHAAYQAATAGRPVGMADLLLGVRRELEKMGKLTSAGDFGPYWHLVGGSA
jgi:hypothetical protein